MYQNKQKPFFLSHEAPVLSGPLAETPVRWPAGVGTVGVPSYHVCRLGTSLTLGRRNILSWQGYFFVCFCLFEHFCCCCFNQEWALGFADVTDKALRSVRPVQRWPWRLFSKCRVCGNHSAKVGVRCCFFLVCWNEKCCGLRSCEWAWDKWVRWQKE